MNTQELKNLVARIQAGDNRTVDSVTLAHFQQTVGQLEYQDAIEAVVTHFKESTAYLMPAHIIAIVRRIREERALRSPAVEDGKTAYPRPINDDAMSAAWNNPAEFRRQQVIYNAQLVREGFEPLRLGAAAA